jgi:hypothetical protein
MGRDQGPTKNQERERQARLAKALRDNLSRRKSQARGRAAMEHEGGRETGLEPGMEAGPDAVSSAGEAANQGLSPDRRVK